MGQILGVSYVNVNTAQGKHLLERINQHRLNLLPPRRYREKSPKGEPPDVRAARKLIRVYEKRRERESEKLGMRISKRAELAREKVMFGDDTAALAAVKAFERLKKI